MPKTPCFSTTPTHFLQSDSEEEDNIYSNSARENRVAAYRRFLDRENTKSFRERLMGLTTKFNKRSGGAGGGGGGGGDGWGMGFYLVFFPEEHQTDFNSSSTPSSSSSSFSPFKSPTINALLKRTNSSHILTRAQSTISICALLIFLTLLLFTLSTFEPNNNFISSNHNFPHYRRHLSQNNPKPRSISPALQGLGTLYTRGTRAMNELVICHVTESVTTKDLKLFLRTFHRSGLLSKSDLLFIFNSIRTPDSFDSTIREENELFLKLIHGYKSQLANRSTVLDFPVDFPVSFDVRQFVKSGKKESEKGEPIWGRKTKSNGLNSSEAELTRTSYGSVVGFGVGELDPENSLSGFLDHVPMSLRRWASYPMILGRVRRNFKHVMLVDVKEVLLFGDPLARFPNRSPESVLLSSTKPGRKSTDKNHQKAVNPAVVMGGARGVRRLSAAMLTEIVRATTHQQRKRKTSVTESALLSQLAANEFVQKSIRLVVSAESLPDASSLSGVAIANHTVVRRGNSNTDIEAVIMKHICSFSIDSSFYKDC